MKLNNVLQGVLRLVPHSDWHDESKVYLPTALTNK